MEKHEQLVGKIGTVYIPDEFMQYIGVEQRDCVEMIKGKQGEIILRKSNKTRCEYCKGAGCVTINGREATLEDCPKCGGSGWK